MRTCYQYNSLFPATEYTDSLMGIGKSTNNRWKLPSGTKKSFYLELDPNGAGTTGCIASGNDAAYALALGAAEKINGHELTATEGLNLFVNRMNEWLRNNQYTDTIVTDPAGNADGDRSTLNDLLGIALQSLKIAEIDNAVRRKEALIHSVEGNEIQVKTTNFLMDPNDLNYNPRVTGVKTGTLEGLANIIIRYESKGYEYICIILGETTSKEREVGALRFTYAADHVPGSGGFDSIVDKLQSLVRIFSDR